MCTLSSISSSSVDEVPRRVYIELTSLQGINESKAPSAPYFITGVLICGVKVTESNGIDNNIVREQHKLVHLYYVLTLSQLAVAVVCV